MIRLGTVYGGWVLPADINLTEKSVVYSVGVGEDISFDLLVQTKWNSNVVLIDPTERAFKHYEEVKLSSEKRKAVFSGDIQPDYINTISKLTPDFSKFTFINKGLWSKKGDLKFYKPLNDKYVSHTFIENMYSKDFTVVETDTLRNIMNSLGHTHRSS